MNPDWLAGIEIPDDAQFATVPSPAFLTSFPTLCHAELIPPEILSAMRPAWGHDGYPEHQVEAFCLRHVIVAEWGLVLDRAGRPYRRSVAQHAQQNVVNAWLAMAQPKEIPPLRGRHVLCAKPGATNYGHWLLEMLPKAWLAVHRLGLGEVTFIVHDVPDPLRQVMLDSMALLGIAPGRLVFRGTAPVAAEELILIDGLTDHGGYMSPLVMRCADHLARRVVPVGPQRLYVSRAGAGARSFANDHEVEAAARADGWTVVRPGELTLLQQIALFRGATAIAGVMGAGLTNAAFALPGTALINFAPATMPDTFFWFIAALRGLAYTEIRCMQRPDRPGLPASDQKLILPVAEFRALLRELG